jgi:hypothetical protein
MLLLMVLPLAIAQQRRELDVATLGNVLYCLQSKVASDAPPHFSEHSFKLRYLVGQQKEAPKEERLQLVVYAPSENKATLYETYFEDVDHRPSIYIGEIGTLRKEGNAMVPEEIWGGVGTYYDVKRMLKRLSSQPAVMVPDEEVKDGQRNCVLQR